MAHEITTLLQRVRGGDQSATEELIPLVYAELHRIAAGRMSRENPGHTLQPTALVNEVFLRMFGGAVPHVEDRAHFLAVASQMMRRILVDHARAKATEKRGGEMQKVELGPTIAMQGSEWHPVDLLELNRAVEALGEENPKLAEAIDMCYFGGLTAEEAALVTGRTAHSVRHDLRFAQAWLRRRMTLGPPD